MKPTPLAEAINELKKLSELHPYKQAGNRDSYSQYNEAWQDALDFAEQKLTELLPKEKEELKNNYIQGGNYARCISTLPKDIENSFDNCFAENYTQSITLNQTK